MVTCSSCSNHASLITNVYPGTGALGEEACHPRSAALSLLVFYAGSKPQKLPKIGHFLEAKVESDLMRLRYSQVKVSVAILKAILTECKQHASLLSKSVLRIILKVMNCSDVDLLFMAPQAFILFSRVRNQEDVIDAEFSLIHSQLIKKFCSEATKEYGTQALRNKYINQFYKFRMRLSALKALEALSDANFFVEGSKMDSSIDAVLDAILSNLNIDQSKPLDSATPSPSLLPSMTAPGQLADPVISDDALKQISEKCLVGICRNSNASTLKTLVASIFKILENNSQLGNSAIVWELLSIVIASSETQYHFVIISYVLERLEEEEIGHMKMIWIKLLQALILDQRLAGLTILELLDTFTNHLLESVINGSRETAEQTSMQIALTEVIGSLAVHLAYPNQINEIIGFLVNRVQYDKASNQLEKYEQTYLFYILMSLVCTMKNNGTGSSADKRMSIMPGTLMYSLFIPLLAHFDIAVVEIRLQLYYLLSSAINFSRLDLRSGVAKLEFQSSLRSGLAEYALSPYNLPVDYVIFGNLLCNSLSVNSPLELGYSLPMLFFLQKRALEVTTISNSQKRAIETAILEYIGFTATFLASDPLKDLVDSMRQSRKASKQFCTAIELTDDSVAALRHKTFSEIEGDEILKPFDSLIDKSEIISILTAFLKSDYAEDLDGLVKAWGQEYVQDSLSASLLRTSLSASSFAMMPNMPSLTSKSKKIIMPRSQSFLKKSESFTEAAAASNKQPHSNEAEKLPAPGPKSLPVIAIGPAVSVADLKEALVTDSKISGDFDNSIPKVQDILKSISTTFGSNHEKRNSLNESIVAPGNIDHEVDFLRTRSRSNQGGEGTTLSQRQQDSNGTNPGAKGGGVLPKLIEPRFDDVAEEQ